MKKEKKATIISKKIVLHRMWQDATNSAMMVGWDSPNQWHKADVASCLEGEFGCLLLLWSIKKKEEEAVGLVTSKLWESLFSSNRETRGCRMSSPSARKSKYSLRCFLGRQKQYVISCWSPQTIVEVSYHILYLKLFHWEWNDELVGMLNVTESTQKTRVDFLFYKHKPLQWNTYMYNSKL